MDTLVPFNAIPTSYEIAPVNIAIGSVSPMISNEIGSTPKISEGIILNIVNPFFSFPCLWFWCFFLQCFCLLFCSILWYMFGCFFPDLAAARNPHPSTAASSLVWGNLWVGRTVGRKATQPTQDPNNPLPQKYGLNKFD